MLKDRERREQTAARIRQLWEESGHTEPEIAEQIGLSLRGYQKAKQTGGISREPLEKLAEFHGVTPDWILTGHERGRAPDLMATMDGVPEDLRAELKAIHDKLDSILNYLTVAGTERQEATPEAAPKSATKSTRQAAS